MRHFESSDAEALYLLNLDPEVMRYTGDEPFKSVEEAADFIRHYDQPLKYGVGRMAVIESGTGEFLGWCGLRYSPDSGELDLGFRFFRKHWRRGFATETARACLGSGFGAPGLREILGRAMTGNKPSIRVLEKIGMTYRKPRTCGGEDGAIYSITREEYQAWSASPGGEASQKFG